MGPLIKPLSSRIIKIDQKILFCSALGEPQLDSCLATSKNNTCSVDYSVCGDEAIYDSSVVTYDENVASKSLIYSSSLFGKIDNESVAGWLGVLFSLFLLYISLYCLVR